MLFFFSKRKRTLIVVIGFQLGWVDSWIVKVKTFIMESALETRLYKDKKSGDFLCAKIWKISKTPPPPPTNTDVTFSFSQFMLRWHLRRYICDTLHVLRSETNLRSHDFKMSGKKTSKYKKEGNFLNAEKAPYYLFDLGLIGASYWDEFRDLPWRVNR